MAFQKSFAQAQPGRRTPSWAPITVKWGQFAERAGWQPVGGQGGRDRGRPVQVKSRITLRETWSRRQAVAMRPVRKAGWVWAGQMAVRNAKRSMSLLYMRPGENV